MVSFTAELARPFGDLPQVATLRVWANDEGKVKWEASLLGVEPPNAFGAGMLADGETLHAAGIRLLSEWLASKS